MYEDAFKTIQSLFKSEQIETIRFSKTGRVSIKWKKDPSVFQYTGVGKVQMILEDLEMFESDK